MNNVLASRRKGELHDPAPNVGISLVELMIAVSVIVVTATALVGHVAMTFRSANAERDRVFAYNAAQSILAEIHAFAADSLDNPRDVDSFDDGTLTKPTLSVAEVNGRLIAPDHVASRNTLRAGVWQWGRQISVAPMPGIDNRSLRFVTVRVYKRDSSGTLRRKASVSSIVNGLAKTYPTTQVHDVYFIAVENIPGWWVHMESIRPFMESMVAEIEGKNPGLEIRTHWITKAGYGRDPLYRPYVNDQVDSETPVEWVYYYPGRMPDGNASTYYYVPSAMRARFVTESGERNGYDSTLNPYPYAFADAFNHAMRFPQAREFHDQRIAGIRARKQAILDAKVAGALEPLELTDMSEEPTLRLLLDDMNANPNEYRNAIVLNLHGELLPLPATRNYSDAAKDPVGLPGVRVVAHPEELRTERPPAAGSDDVRLRAYAYVTDPNGYSGSDRMPEDRPIAIQVMDLDLTDGKGGLFAGVKIENLAGGVDVNGSDRYSPIGDSVVRGHPSLKTGEMCHDVAFVDPGVGLRKYTLIRLYNTPLTCRPVTHGSNVRGLFANERSRLYGREYVPSCTGTSRDFSRDLYASGDGPKNTARWVITVPRTVFASRRWTDLSSPPNYIDPLDTTEPDRVLSFRTRIWDPELKDPLTTGTHPQGSTDELVQPNNFSETYTWWADSRDDVPSTERFQHQGDPRHNPYKDLLDGDKDFPNGYNWFFDNLSAGGEDAVADFAGLNGSRLQNLWRGRARQDLPRSIAVLREGLIRSRTVFSTLNGFSFYYVGNGGEIGSDGANGYRNSIPTALEPFGKPGQRGHVNTITGQRTFVRAPGSSGYWWGVPWLGELCPDSEYARSWIAPDRHGQVAGNLPAGSAAGQFYKAAAQDTYAKSDFTAWGTTMKNSQQRTAGEGCTMFFNTGTASESFHHHFANGVGVPTTIGSEVISNYNLSMPASPIVNRPFSIDSGGGLPSEWYFSEYADTRTAASIGRVYFDTTASQGVASAMVDIADGSDSDQMSIIVNGFAASTVDGVSFIARYCLASALHSFLEGSNKSRRHRIKATPRVEIMRPTEVDDLTNPVSIEIEFNVDWKRWDSRDYTAGMSGHTEEERDLEYALLYSRDNGITWQNMQDDSPVVPGTRNGGSALLADFGAGSETYSWSVEPGQFGMGSYLIRVEAYRVGQLLHYAHHQRKVFIER